MKIVNPIPTYNLRTVHPRSFAVATSEKGNIVRVKHAHHSPRASLPNAAQIALWNQSWVKWRRKWLAYFATLWLQTLTTTDRNRWRTQAAMIPFQNYRNLTSTRNGFQLFIWYQSRWFDLNLSRYIPFPANAADFPHNFALPLGASTQLIEPFSSTRSSTKEPA